MTLCKYMVSWSGCKAILLCCTLMWEKCNFVLHIIGRVFTYCFPTLATVYLHIWAFWALPFSACVCSACAPQKIPRDLFKMVVDGWNQATTCLTHEALAAACMMKLIVSSRTEDTHISIHLLTARPLWFLFSS